jgi:4-hydroxy-tetrahydrodipicolinate synthase
MGNAHLLRGVFAAAVTPLDSDYSPDLDGLEKLINFLASRGCQGVLLMGTTGEGPSLSISEREQAFMSVRLHIMARSSLQYLAGTGTPSLEDSIYLTKKAFDYGFKGVVVLPPYYYRKASEDGLFNWYQQVIKKSVPSDGMLLGYHIPAVSGVSISLDLISRMKDAFPEQFVGIKDSSGDPAWASALGSRFGSDLVVLTGNDRLFTHALRSNASGCITALANVISPLLRKLWDHHQEGYVDVETQETINHYRDFLDRYPPAPATLKLLLSRVYEFPSWKLKPPLQEIASSKVDEILSQFQSLTG